ncbi:MAG: RNA-binding protein hfq [Crinalium sp.]
MSEMDTNLPSTRQVQNFIKDKKEVEVKLLTNDLLVGRVIWQDTECVCLGDNSTQTTLIWRQAIAFIKIKS